MADSTGIQILHLLAATDGPMTIGQILQQVGTSSGRHGMHQPEDYREREVGELERQSGQVYRHLGTRRDEPPRP